MSPYHQFNSHNATMANSYRETQRKGIPLSQELVDWFYQVEDELGDVIQALYEWDIEVPPGVWNRAFCSERGRKVLISTIVSRRGMRQTSQQLGIVKYGRRGNEAL